MSKRKLHIVRRTYIVKPNDAEIEAVLDECMDREGRGESQWRAMSYEQGVRAGIDWVLGNTSEHPLNDD